MIVVDVPMPERCRECPCVFYIYAGEYEGSAMCNAAEWNDISKGFKKNTGEYLVDDLKKGRPEDCPIISEVVTG